MCDDLLNVFLKKSFSSQPLVLGYVNEFVCQQPQIICAVHANLRGRKDKTPTISYRTLQPPALLNPAGMGTG